jgi:hypothetical protein
MGKRHALSKCHHPRRIGCVSGLVSDGGRGLVVPVVLVLIVLAIEYSKAKRHSPTLPFVAAGFVFGIAWFTLTNLSVVVAIGTT